MEQFIKKLARGAGAILRDGFRHDIEINHKTGHWDVVTQYDLASDKYIQTHIKKKFPKHSILSEETGREGKNDHLWVIDPLDGTRNFSRGIPFFCVSIAFVRKNKILYGAIYDPVHDELFFAKDGKGAILNGKSISVSTPEILDSAMASVLWHANIVGPKIVSKLQKFARDNQFWQTNLASAALSIAYVACGRVDLHVSKGAFPWDYAGATFIVKQAGGRVSDFQGRPYQWNSDGVIAANPKIHKLILKQML